MATVRPGRRRNFNSIFAWSKWKFTANQLCEYFNKMNTEEIWFREIIKIFHARIRRIKIPLPKCGFRETDVNINLLCWISELLIEFGIRFEGPKVRVISLIYVLFKCR